ncbi:chemoreceptor glutamine deamidase CheD [Alteromonas sp. ASW11-130]|uniref:chemoreceptor glutamine deamidase CheD n=1 Tax=Alteromonas sp. ASW11-130 TaxID=3015775 RepID=UPI0022419CCB|nr:chemoreceptor glutamine deamidase CheD [Alteromonas sp. ASW11-130]MCW8092987.1 chemoreceptor glutamine deamidase CheD [Alteromonas sp. ASW11-130]
MKVDQLNQSNRYFDRHFQCQAVKILPGEYYATSAELLIVTVLGSCVSVCLRDPIAKVGGMNHFLLPYDEGGIEQDSDSARYGSYAMEVLTNELMKRGAARSRLEAKVFGGGNVLRGLTVANVGERNADFVTDFLRTEQIPIVASDLLGEYPRKVYFFTHTGEVKVKKLKRMHNSTIFERESEYKVKLLQFHGAGEVELFE